MATRSFPAWGILLSLWAGCPADLVGAQATPEPSRPRLVSASEGEAIVIAAWDLRRGQIPKPDCSHFVHAVYAKAGFTYEYAQSADLFEGTDPFQRVTSPQPGDLVVWQGHVGIVVDPVEHSFYSSVVAGFAIEDYRSNYWVGRGSPRFYRYLVVDDARGIPVPLRDRQTARAAPPVDSDAAPAAAASVPEPRGGGSSVTPPEFRSRSLEADVSEAETRDAVFVSLRDKPAKNEVLAAIVGTIDGRAAGLAQSLRLESAPRVVVADSFNVVGLYIKKNSGWAEVEVQQRAAFRFGSADPTPATSRWRVTLNRQEQVWVLLLPRDPIFLRSDLAKTVLEHHLAALQRTSANNGERRKVEKILNDLPSRKNAAEAELGSH